MDLEACPQVLFLKKLDSTNLQAKREAQAGAPPRNGDSGGGTKRRPGKTGKKLVFPGAVRGCT